MRAIRIQTRALAGVVIGLSLLAHSLHADELALKRANAGAPDPVKVVRADVAALSNVSAAQLKEHIQALAPAAHFPGLPLDRLVTDLKRFIDKPISDEFLQNWLTGDLSQIVNPGKSGTGQVKTAIDDFGSALKRDHLAPEQIDALLGDLRALVPDSLRPVAPEGPAHKYIYSVDHAPRYDQSVLVEDFETDDAIWKTWYQPGWSNGLVAKTAPDFKCEGSRGLSMTHDGPGTKYTSMAKIAKPPQSIRGMNAIRLCAFPASHGEGVNEGGLSLGFIDGTDEIWQMDLPLLFERSTPLVIEVQLADFRKVLRRNNGVIDLENRDFAFWLKGTYRISVDDIRFVHDPALPAFVPAPPSSPRTP